VIQSIHDLHFFRHLLHSISHK